MYRCVYIYVCMYRYIHDGHGFFQCFPKMLQYHVSIICLSGSYISYVTILAYFTKLKKVMFNGLPVTHERDSLAILDFLRCQFPQLLIQQNNLRKCILIRPSTAELTLSSH